MRHHQEANGVHFHFGGHADVLFGYVRFGAVGGHTDGGDAAVPGHFQVVNGTDPRQQQRGDFGVFHLGHDGAEVFLVAVGREAVVQ